MMFHPSPSGRVILALLFALALGRLECAGADPAPKRTVVMISLDGLAGFYLDDPKAEIPTLREMAKEGVRASSMKAVNPTVTWPNHTTLITGDQPGRHGVAGNIVFDRDLHRRVTLIADPELNSDEIIKVRTVFDAAKAAGLKTAALRWPATRGCKALDLAMPDMKNNVAALPFVTPSLLERGRAAGILAVDDYAAGLTEKHSQITDENTAKIAEMLLHDDHPALMAIHLSEVDHTEHQFGPKSAEAYAAIKAADGYVQRIRTALQREAGETGTLLIVSDHGFSPIEHEIAPLVVLRQAGLIKTAGAKILPGPVVNVTQGGADFVYIDSPDAAVRAELVAKVQAAFQGVAGLRKIVTAPEFAAYGLGDPATGARIPDVVLLAEYGYYFGNTSDGIIPVEEKSERRGGHGHDSNLPQLHATFVGAGAGLGRGVNLGEITNLDVAPTIARLLGISLPDTDGEPLEKALAP